MVSPIDYSLKAVNPADKVMQGLFQGQQFIAQAEQRGIAQDANNRANAQEQRSASLFPLQQQQAQLNIQKAELGLAAQKQQLQDAQQADVRKQQYQADFQDFIGRGPSLTPNDLIQFNAKYPEVSAATKEAYESMKEPQAKALKGALAQTATALRNGNVEYAMEVGKQYIAAAKESGDAQSAAMSEAALKIAEIDPEQGYSYLQTIMSGIDMDLAKSIADGGSKTESPSGLRELEGRAAAGGLEKGTPEYERFMLTGGKSGEGQISVDIEGESKLRKEFNGLDVVRDFSKVNDAYARIQASASEPDAAGDLALIFNYMKMLDPGSVVREGEFATAQNAAGVGDRVRNLYNNVAAGERLNDNQRKSFVGRAGKLLKAQKGNYTKAAKKYRSIADQYGFNANRIIEVDGAESQQVGLTNNDMAFVSEVKALVAQGGAMSQDQRQRLRDIREKMRQGGQ